MEVNFDIFLRELNGYDIPLKNGTWIIRLKNINSIKDFKCCILPESEYANGNSGRNEHGTHIHIETLDGKEKGEIDIITKEIIGFNSKNKKRILNAFSKDYVKEEILEIWNNFRNNKIKFDEKFDFVLE